VLSLPLFVCYDLMVRFDRYVYILDRIIRSYDLTLYLRVVCLWTVACLRITPLADVPEYITRVVC
jgi:hypothetical protein